MSIWVQRRRLLILCLWAEIVGPFNVLAGHNKDGRGEIDRSRVKRSICDVLQCSSRANATHFLFSSTILDILDVRGQLFHYQREKSHSRGEILFCLSVVTVLVVNKIRNALLLLLLMEEKNSELKTSSVPVSAVRAR